MGSKNPQTESSVILMLQDMGSENVCRDYAGLEISPEEAGGLTWKFKDPLSDLVAYADSMEETGVYLGLGGRYTPGVALMCIHIEEEIATAPVGASRIIEIVDGSIEAY